MSRLWPSVYIALAPGRVAVSDGRIMRDAAVDLPGWGGALKALGRLLAEGSWRGSAAITLSHHFAHVHCLLSPPVMLKPPEMRGWIQDYLDRHYGEPGSGWQLAWQNEAPGKPFLASSIATSALAELEETTRGASLKPGRVQPWLAVSWNRSYRMFGKAQGWFALAEPGRLMLASMAAGTVHSLRSVAIQDDPVRPLSDLVRREALIAGNAPDAPVWVDSVLMRPDWNGVKAGLDLRALASAGESMASMLGS